MKSDIQQLRQRLKAQRLQVPMPMREQAAEKIWQQLNSLSIFREAQSVACYIAFAGEVSTTTILANILAQGKSCYLPCLAVSPQPHLLFAEYHAATPLILNRYQIPEPDLALAQLFPVEQLDCVLVPLLAFDPQGHRLGMGAGYYDRTFAFNKTKRPPIPLIGLAYAFQSMAHFPVNAWDVPLTGVITENGYQQFME